MDVFDHSPNKGAEHRPDDDFEHHDKLVKVNVKHINETEKTSFKEKRTATLQAVWDRAYVELKIDRQPKDVFQTDDKDPVPLINHLSLTLEEAHKRKIIHDYDFAIVCETGGA